MIENYITKITVDKSRGLNNVEIPISTEKRQHLILTGKNGSGKTSLLLEINKFLTQIQNGSAQYYSSQLRGLEMYQQNLQSESLSVEDRHNVKNAIISIEQWFERYGGVKIEFSTLKEKLAEVYTEGKFVLAYFDSKRYVNLNIPKGINKIELQKSYQLNEKANSDFIQFIVNLKADRSFARDDGELSTVEKIDNWFLRLESRLRYIFDADDLKLNFDRRTYNFEITAGKFLPFSFDKLSDGYSAIISIVTELILRMEAHEVKSYDLEGIVIIDEIETHLRVDLQKKILPFLIDFFPRIQFVVTTHSPFVLSSLSNATIFDLESKTVTTDLSAYSYDALLEGYFETDKYSQELKDKIIAYENLILIKEPTAMQKNEIGLLKDYFTHVPQYLSKELLVKLQQIELLELSKK